MGYLYSALDQQGGWKVALKVLSDRLRNDKTMLTRFRLEAEAGLKLAHPNILRTQAMRQTEDIYGPIHYMVMELVKGISLHELLSLRKRTLSWRQSSDVIMQAATGLQYAHEQGLVHRDIKPENLLIRSDGAIKVLDFGLSLIRGSEAEVVLGQSCLGTADYIAPEQSLDSTSVDPRADIYSLGCTFYFLVTARTPFPYDTISKKLNGHRTERPQPLLELNPKVPERLAKIVHKMMAKKPKNRFRDAAEVCEYMAPYAVRKPIEFDFDAVLKDRAQVAEKRLATESIIRGDSRISSVSKLEVEPPLELKSPKSDTSVGKDTLLNRRKR
jgi:serine/threonine-protein kinase